MDFVLHSGMPDEPAGDQVDCDTVPKQLIGGSDGDDTLLK